MKTETREWLINEAKEWCNALVCGAIIGAFLFTMFLIMVCIPTK